MSKPVTEGNARLHFISGGLQTLEKLIILLNHVVFIVEQSAFFMRNFANNDYFLESLFEVLEASLELTRKDSLVEMEDQLWILIRDKTVNLIQIILSQTKVTLTKPILIIAKRIFDNIPVWQIRNIKYIIIGMFSDSTSLKDVFKNDIVYTKFLDDGDLVKFENILASSYEFLRGMIIVLVNFEKLAGK